MPNADKKIWSVQCFFPNNILMRMESTLNVALWSMLRARQVENIDPLHSKFVTSQTASRFHVGAAQYWLPNIWFLTRGQYRLGVAASQQINFKTKPITIKQNQSISTYLTCANATGLKRPDKIYPKWKSRNGWAKLGVHGEAAPLTSDSAGPQQVNDVHVVSKVTENLQLWHQCLLLRGMSIGWDDITRTFIRYFTVPRMSLQHSGTGCVRDHSLFSV